MVVKQLQVKPQEDLVIDQETLRQAHLGEHLQLLVHRGEIRIVSQPVLTPEQALEEGDDLAGCMGQESAAEYDFELKISGLYEAR